MSKHTPYDLMCKFLIIGSSQVGKTNLLTRFSDDVFSESHVTTIGVDFKFKEMNVNGKHMKMQIWDTAGQEKFRTLTQNYYKGAHGVLLVYSIDSISSFQEVTNWVNSLKQHGRSEIKIILVANKVDLQDKRMVSREQGEDLANMLGVEYFETSAKLGDNVQEVFTRLAELAEAQYNGKASLPVLTEENSYKINLTSKKTKKSKECC